MRVSTKDWSMGSAPDVAYHPDFFLGVRPQLDPTRRRRGNDRSISREIGASAPDHRGCGSDPGHRNYRLSGSLWSADPVRGSSSNRAWYRAGADTTDACP